MEFGYMFGWVLGWMIVIAGVFFLFQIPRLLGFAAELIAHKLDPPAPPTIEDLLASAESSRRAAVAAHVKRNAAEHIPWEYQWQQFTGRAFGDHLHARDCDCMAIITARVRGNHR